MKYFFLTSLVVIMFMTFGAVIVSAETGFNTTSKPCDPKSETLCNPLNYDSVFDLIPKLLDIVAQVGLVICTFFIILAGFKYVTAGGNMTKVQDAHKILLWSVIGTAVLLGAKVLASILSNTVNQIIK